MSVRSWSSLAATTAVAASLLAAAAACSSSGSSSPPAAAGATSAAPVSMAVLIAGSKQEKGLVIYSNALSSQMQEVTKAFQAKYPWIHVTVTDDGFLWNGRPHSSLSGIARAITGTTWNGPRFFGLRDTRIKGARNGS